MVSVASRAASVPASVACSVICHGLSGLVTQWGSAGGCGRGGTLIGLGSWNLLGKLCNGRLQRSTVVGSMVTVIWEQEACGGGEEEGA